MFLQLSEVVEWVDIIQLTGVNQTHKKITDPGAVGGFIEVCVLTVIQSFE
jgi:hypothetical protein